MEGIRSIVVHLDATPRSEVRLRLAHALAQAFQAQLAGLYSITATDPTLPPAMSEAAAAGPPGQDERERGKHARALFERVAERGAAPPPCWEDAGRTASYTAVAARALTADLVVFGQHDATDARTSMEAGLVPSTLIESGTPALVVPHSGSFAPDALAKPGLTLLLAWKPTREAARAVRAALPWLRDARQVHLAVDSVGAAIAPWPGAPQVRAWLELQGVTAPVRAHAVGHTSPGDMLLSMATDVSADLLVMGCFGHSRARELVLGDASRSVLRSMTLPTLMAH